MTPPEAAYTFGDVLRLTEADRGQLGHWTKLGVITPNVRRSGGTGDPRLYDATNVIQTRVAVLLARFKIPAPVLEWAVGAPLLDALKHGDQFLVLYDPNAEMAESCKPSEIRGALNQETQVVIDLQNVRRRVGVV